MHRIKPQFFGRVTGSFLVEQKNEPIYTIPFEQSPKLLFGTNGVIRQHDPATERRLWSQVLSDYYHVQTPENDYRETRTVRDDVGCNLMDGEYSEADWQRDIAFLIQCLQYHLSLPKRTFTDALKAYCRFAGLTYNPASITGKEKDGEKWQTRMNGSETLIVCIYVQTPDSKQTDIVAAQAVDQDLPF